MTRLFVQYLANYNNENLPNSPNVNFAKEGSKLSQTINKPSGSGSRLLNIYQSGEISPNLVTLISTQLWCLINRLINKTLLVSHVQNTLFQKCAISVLFFCVLVFSTVNSTYTSCAKYCRWLDLNWGPLVPEATALPTEPQQLPRKITFFTFQLVWKQLFLTIYYLMNDGHYSKFVYGIGSHFHKRISRLE